MRTPWFVRGDIDGFFGLFIDNLLQLMLIDVLCRHVCGFPPEFITGRILPGAALSILVGNAFYSWQASRLMRATGRNDVTALPYGVNTVSLLAYIFLIMGPVYQQTGDSRLAWQAGLFACLVGGVIEIIGAFVGDRLRRHTPRAALLSALAGIAITFIAMGFVFQIFASPALALLPMLIILITYASRVKWPFGLPGGLLAVLLGTATAWATKAFGLPLFEPGSGAYALSFYPPVPAGRDLFALLTGEGGWKYMAVILPMGLFNVVGSLQNLESAEAAGDRYETKSSLLVNGLGSLAAALFGSPFPTTIYIGHPAWKAMGARAGYSALNGAVVTVLCMMGGVSLVLRLVPLEAALGILLWIGIFITAQAFQDIPKSHALGVAFGLIPSLAAWALQLVEVSLRKAGKTLFEIAPAFGSDLYIHGLISLSQGFLLSSMVFSAVLIFLIEKQFLKAGGWLLAAAALSLAGLIHAYELTPSGVKNKFGLAAAPEFAIVYGITAALLIFLHFLGKPLQDRLSQPKRVRDHRH
ncbi:MAG: NCS2 family permease [Elusimicrobia bacterium]|nr:NCS2 family permease [Elusimicrobiota bacterium]